VGAGSGLALSVNSSNHAFYQGKGFHYFRSNGDSVNKFIIDASMCIVANNTDFLVSGPNTNYLWVDTIGKKVSMIDTDISGNLSITGDGSFNGSLTVNADGTNYGTSNVLDAKGYITSTGLKIYTTNSNTLNGQIWSGISTSDVWLASSGKIYFRTNGISSGTNVLTVNSNNIAVTGAATISSTLTVTGNTSTGTTTTGALTASSLSTSGTLGFTNSTYPQDKIRLYESESDYKYAIGIDTGTMYLSTFNYIDFVHRNTNDSSNVSAKLRINVSSTNPTITSHTGTTVFTGNLSITGNELGLGGANIYGFTTSIYIGNLPINNGNFKQNTATGEIDIYDSNNFTLGTGCLSSLDNKDSSNTLRYENRIRANTAIGYGAAFSAKSAQTTVAIGYEALNRAEQLLENNTAIGHRAGYYITTTNDIKNNTFLGAATGFSPENSQFSNSTAVGYEAEITANNQIVLGRSSEHVKIPGNLQTPTLYITQGTGANGIMYRPSTNVITESDVNIDTHGTINGTVFFAQTGITDKGRLHNSTSTKQGTYIGWNSINGDGRATILNSTTVQGANQGGFVFYNRLTDNTGNSNSEAPVLIVDFSKDGDIKANSFNATSDYRIKENIQTISGEEFTVDELRPVSYTLKSNQKPTLGFIAHEVQEHVPSAVSGEKDGEKMQSVDYNQIIPILVKEIQELKKRVAYLEQNQK
jgi:hypothetical protein